MGFVKTHHTSKETIKNIIRDFNMQNNTVQSDSQLQKTALPHCQF